MVDEKRVSKTDAKEEKTQKKTSDTKFQEAGQGFRGVKDNGD